MMRRLLFAFFFLSGFCGLLYQVVYLRLAFGAFGINTPVISAVLSVFMFGLSSGSWASGRLFDSQFDSKGLRARPARLYAAVEFGIGLGAWIVPAAFKYGSNLLIGLGSASSFGYYLSSSAIIAIALLPWCFLMGMTIPLGQAILLQSNSSSGRSFTALYLANIIGALLGVLSSAFILIEMLGLSRTLLLASSINWLIGILAFVFLRKSEGEKTTYDPREASTNVPADLSAVSRILFVTGFVSMALEVAWTRAFVPIVKTTIYAFAMLLIAYLIGTLIGIFLCRSSRRIEQSRIRLLLLLAPAAAAFSFVINDPRLNPTALTTLLGIIPISLIFGYCTPALIDGASHGDPGKSGKLYAINAAGCILGPLVSGYLLVAVFGVRLTAAVLCLTLLCTLVRPVRVIELLTGAVSCAALLLLNFGVLTFEDGGIYDPTAQVRRDHVATVVSYGTGMWKNLLVNGIGVTNLTAATKNMAHLPLLFLNHPPQNSLVICLGMGTTFRSLASWGIETTAVELVPSVKEAYGFYFPETAAAVDGSHLRIVVDDGRRYLARTSEKFDIITLDPPPPMEASNLSLLYSEEFYRLAKLRLKPGGLIQQWIAAADPHDRRSALNAILHQFRNVRAFWSPDLNCAIHVIASDAELPVPTKEEIEERIPPAAAKDLLEWYDGDTVSSAMERILRNEFNPRPYAEGTPSLSDDWPTNEYFFVRRRFRYDPPETDSYCGVMLQK